MLLISDGLIKPAAHLLNLGDRVVLVLAGRRIVLAVMRHAQPSKIVLGAISSVAVEMGNLAKLWGQVAMEVETKRAAAGALNQYGGLRGWA